MVGAWALTSRISVPLARSHRRTLPSWQPVATCVPDGWKATASTRLGCGRLFVGASAANFHARSVLSALAVQKVTLSGAKATSRAGPSWAQVWIVLPNVAGIGWPAVQTTFHVTTDRSSHAATKA